MIGFVMWAEALEVELRNAGFNVSRVAGYPTVVAQDFWEAARVLEFAPVIAAARWTHRGAVFFTPPAVAPARGIPA